MTKYINADKIISHLNDEIEACGNPDVYSKPVAYGTYLGLQYAKSAVETAETADVQEVRHGKWIWRKDDCSERECICSICEGELPHTFTGGTIEHPFIEKEYIEETDYCPLCGARMDSDEK